MIDCLNYWLQRIEKAVFLVTKKQNKKQAFTLIEVITTITITVLLLSVVLASYASMTRVIQDVKLSQKLQREVHFAMQRITDRMRNGSINYSAMIADKQAMNAPQKLILGTGTDKVEIERKGLVDDVSTLLFDGERIFSDLFTVEKFHITVYPLVDPYGSTSGVSNKYTSNYKQPKLTIELTVQSVEKPYIAQSLQTTISSRKYK